MATRRAKATANASKTTMTTVAHNGDDEGGGRGGGEGKIVSPLEMAGGGDGANANGVDGNDDGSTPPPSTIEERYRSEREQTKRRHWKDSEYAAGLVEPTWGDELESSRRRAGGSPCGCWAQACREEIDPGCGCTLISALVCTRMGAGRIGNMAVLKERYVMVEVDDDDGADADGGGQEREDGFVDEEDPSSLRPRNSAGGGNSSKPSIVGQNNAAKKTKKRTVRKREIQYVVGPFWPMLVFITYPLIFGVSALTLWNGVPGRPWYVQAAWVLLTAQLIRSLFNTGFRDPGMLRRHAEAPDMDGDLENEESSRRRRRIGFRWGNEAGPWRWSDQAQSYRPKNSMYCPDCKVVIEEFDHTCPWTGTAIGKKNMGSFQMFVGLVFVCLIMDIFLLTAGAL